VLDKPLVPPDILNIDGGLDIGHVVATNLKSTGPTEAEVATGE
jgi:hypothetical protein